jgi:DNA repair protein RadD
VIAQFCKDITEQGGRVMVTAHVKELLSQAYEKIKSLGIDCGLYSASLNSRHVDNDVIVAGIQSVYQRGAEIAGSRPFNAVIVDEAHRIPLTGDGMYRKLIADLTICNPRLRVIGLTATPYRTDVGMVCQEDGILHEISYEAHVRDLIDQGYLSPLIGKGSVNEVDMSGVKIRGDYVASEMEEAFIEGDKVRLAVDEIRKLCANRQSVIIFACGVKHATMVKQFLDCAGETCDVVVGETPSKRRDGLVDAFKKKSLKYLINVNCFCEGFDAPNVDAVVLLRATTSPGLYYQMVGRGLRLCDGKANCLVLDFGGNVQRHGAIDAMTISKKSSSRGDGDAPVKTCPQCQRINHASVVACVECGFEFPPREISHEHFASNDAPLSGSGLEDWPVDEVVYSVHQKRGAAEGDPRSMRVTYISGRMPVADEWICVEHAGFAWEKAYSWWYKRTKEPMPRSAEEAVAIASAGFLSEPTSIRTRKRPDDKYLAIVKYELGPPKPQREPGVDDEEVVWKDNDGNQYEVPF